MQAGKTHLLDNVYAGHHLDDIVHQDKLLERVGLASLHETVGEGLKVLFLTQVDSRTR